MERLPVVRSRLPFLATALFLALSCASTKSHRESPPDCHALGGQFLEDVRADRFDAVVQLFHYPEEFTRAERADDQANLRRFLRVLVDEMGEPNDSQPQPKIASTGSVRVETAKPEFWSIFAADRERSAWSAHVEFSRDGPGFVGFECVQVGLDWRLRAVSFGLVSATHDVHARIREIEGALRREFSSPEE